jgi:putative transposase
MPRKLRLEFPGARYHVINRGNYRADVFGSDHTKTAFEDCLWEACEKWSWLLHAFVLMRNHFHLAIETPEANLVRGMQWLEATFANRFNRFRHEHGHLFQGRYRALVIGEDYFLGQVCDYIHLNPCRAGFQPMEKLSEYRHSSYWYLHRPEHRPKSLQPASILQAAGGLGDDPAGWRRYAEHLARAPAEAAGQRRHYAALTSGWAVGSDAFKAATIAQHAPVGSARAWTLPGAEQMRTADWGLHLEKSLSALGRSVAEARLAPKSAVWKLAVAAWLRDRVRARSNWLSEKLCLGTPSVVSRNLARYRCLIQQSDHHWRTLTSTFAA